MTKKNNQNIRYALSMIGLILFVATEFLPVYSRTSYSDIPIATYSAGHEADIWLYLFVPAIILLALGFFGKHLVVKIIFYFSLILTLAFHAFINVIFFFPPKAPYTETLEIGYYLAITGLLFLSGATIIALHSKKIKIENSGLLDTEI